MADKGYEVIARRWRPKQFSELVGQDHVVRTLGNAIAQGRIAHAYLFVGPRGTGKTSSARLFSKSLNWEDGPSLEVPEDSELGAAIMEGRCLDVIEIDGASNNSVEEVRRLRDECRYAPSQCRYKIYVIDEVHMLSQQAFNALLKTLEEPPPHVKFVFATTEAHKVLPTIISRCQRFEFRSIPADLIAGKLKEICATEEIEAEDEALATIARMAMGGMRDAQSILDQMISFCGRHLKQADVLEVYGLAAPERVAELLRAVTVADYETILRFTDAFAEEGIDLYRALLDLQEGARTGLLNAIRDGGRGAELSPERYGRILDALRAGEDSVRMGLSDKTNFEVTLIRAVEAGRSRAIDSVLRELTALAPPDVGAGDKKKTETVAKAPVSKAAEEAQELPPPASPAAASEKGQEEVTREEALPPADPTPVEALAAVAEAPKTDSLSEEQVAYRERAEPAGLVEMLDDSREGRVVDESAIAERVKTLPSDARKILEDDFRVRYVSIERVDADKLI